MLIKNIDLGETITSEGFDEAVIIGYDYQDYWRAIGWVGEPKINKKVYQNIWRISERVDSCKYIVNVNDFSYGSWVRSDIECSLYGKIISATQVCMSCNLSAPHKQPNLPYNKYICLYCDIMASL